jgi:hypothetical protein
MKRELYFLAIILSIATSGCQTSQNLGTPSPNSGLNKNLRNQVSAAQDSLSQVEKPLGESEAQIDTAKSGVQTGADKNQIATQLDTAHAKIEEGKSLLTKASIEIGTAMNTATQAVAAAEISDKAIKNLQKQNSDLNDKLKSQQQWVYKLLAGVAAFIIVAGIAICVASALTGFASMQIGIGVSVGGITLLILTLTIQKYATYLTAACGVLLLALMIYFGWKLFTSFKANKELVQFGEAVKATASDDVKKKLFGDGTSPHPNSIADSIQSDSTQKIVDAAQMQLKIDQAKNS